MNWILSYYLAVSAFGMWQLRATPAKLVSVLLMEMPVIYGLWR